MKKSHLRSIIRESIRGLMIEQVLPQGIQGYKRVEASKCSDGSSHIINTNTAKIIYLDGSPITPAAVGSVISHTSANTGNTYYVTIDAVLNQAECNMPNAATNCAAYQLSTEPSCPQGGGRCTLNYFHSAADPHLPSAPKP